ncbi:exosome component 10 [Daktulosphaira vitifoliae]|uniref:exosome component 10 n=1 Tax=Daktulosphaira vitifoliae TaxID=58002 RepID=UPI0021AAA797|nr:exosome component 10 [Daktulosphaira vitifoliae]
MSDFKTIIEGIKASNNLPSGVNWNFYTSYPKYMKTISARQTYILKLISALLKNQRIQGNIRSSDHEGQFQLIEEGNDTILDRVAFNIDSLNGSFKHDEMLMTPKRLLSENPEEKAQIKKKVLVHGRIVERPQAKFKVKVDNRPVPFKPLLKHKPNSITPLNLCLETNEEGVMFYKHPYETELETFKVPDEHLKVKKAVQPESLDNTKLVEISNEDQLNMMVSELNDAKELAIDLEAHNYRTYQGFTCLMQISTRNTDYLIDTLELRDKLQVLNEIFTNPNVVKVFHGADSDIVWLQRDLGLYVINMFDTYQACKILNFVRKGLEFLLSKYCNVNADKSFQLYDWRTRPLSEDAKRYARCDTHYLLYIYDMMKKDLMAMSTKQNNYVEIVFQRSTDVCKMRYEINILNNESHMSMYKRSKKLFDLQQMFALKSLFSWRDKIARELDESPGYVLPNHMLIKISETLPKEFSGILACCSPIPPLVRQCLHEIHHIIKKAREQSFENVKKCEENLNNYQNVIKHEDIDLISLHDYSKADKTFSGILPTLLEDKDFYNYSDCNDDFIFAQDIRVFQDIIKNSKTSKSLSNIIFKRPYDSYLKTLEYKKAYNKLKKEKNTEDASNNQMEIKKTVPMDCPDKIMFNISKIKPVKEVKKESIDLTIVKEETPKPDISTKVVKSLDTPNIAEVSSKKPNFTPHNYSNTNFSKFHNQSKDVLFIAKRLQQNKNKSKKKNKPKRLQKTV